MADHDDRPWSTPATVFPEGRFVSEVFDDEAALSVSLLAQSATRCP